jgi:hypothetical protein
MRDIVFPYLSHKERDIPFLLCLYHKGRDIQIVSCVLGLISNLTENSLFPLRRTFALIRMPRLIFVNNVSIKFHKNLPSVNRVSLCRQKEYRQTNRQIDITRLVFAILVGTGWSWLRIGTGAGHL